MRGRLRGFTLLEVLIALAMVGTILTLVYTTFSTTTRTIERRETHARSLHRANFIVRHLTDHLQSAYLDVAAYYRFDDPYDLFDGGGDAIAFWTQSPPQTRRAAGGALQRLEYRLQPTEDADAEGGMELRCEAFADPPAPDGEPIASWAVPVESAAFEYHDGEGWVGGWDIVAEARLPRAVRVTVTVLNGSGEPMDLRSAVALPVTGETQIEAEEAQAASPTEELAETGEVEVEVEPPGEEILDQEAAGA